MRIKNIIEATKEIRKNNQAIKIVSFNTIEVL